MSFIVLGRIGNSTHGLSFVKVFAFLHILLPTGFLLKHTFYNYDVHSHIGWMLVFAFEKLIKHSASLKSE